MVMLVIKCYLEMVQIMDGVMEGLNKWFSMTISLASLASIFLRVRACK